jgi:putative ABC transport system ATP-binding protein
MTDILPVQPVPETKNLPIQPVPGSKVKTRRPMIVAKNVTKEFMIGKEPYHALRGLSATIYEAEFAIIYGPSGSGKSTFVNTLIGLEKPTTGEVWVDGIEIDKMTEDQRADLRAKRFGVVSQTPIWIKALTTLENVAMPLLIANVKEKLAYQRATETLTIVGLLDWAKHKPTELSGGQQQRVSFARSLVNDPHILVLDEPTGNLDSASSDQVLKLLQDLNRQRKRTILMITHNLDYLPLADRTIMIRDGQITEIKEQEGKKL